MILLDMNKKSDARISNRHFTLENDILTLEVGLGDYSTDGKTITATFSPSGVETAYLDVVDGVVSLPIYAGYIEAGINYIQLNFRWDTDKLEQSPMMLWRVESSLESTGVTPEDVDIVTQLIAEADRVVDEAGDVRVALDESTGDATAINNTLADAETGTIKQATDINSTLAQAIVDAGIAEDAITDPVTGAIALAEAAEDDLTNPTTGAIKLAVDAKEDIEQAIIDNEIVTQTEFNEHKADYATQIDFIINNYLQGHNWQASTNIQNFSSDNEIMTFTGGGSGMVSANNWVRPINYLLLTNTNIIYTTCLAKTISFTSGKLFGFGIGYHSNDTLLNLESYTRASMVMSSVSNAYPTMSADLGHRVEVKQPMSIDLTETFGAGNEPTKEEMDTLIDVLGGWFDGELTPTQKQLANWQLKMIRENRSAIIALGGSI